MPLELNQSFLNKVYAMRDVFIKEKHDIVLYDYQREASDAILRAALGFEGETYGIEISRQSGKTEAIVLTMEFILLFINELLALLGKKLKGGFNIFIGAPQKEQAKTDFDRLRSYLDVVGEDFDVSYDEANGTTLRMSGSGNTVFCMPVSVTAHIESKTAHLIVMEEMQDVPDAEYEKKVMPMGTATNANTIMIGTAGYSLCRFYKLIEGGDKKRVFKYDCWEVMRQKQEAYKRDGDDFHLRYVDYINSRISELGDDNPQIRSQYFLIWQLEKGMFITEDRFNNMVADGKEGRPYCTVIREDLVSQCFASIDVAKESDVTFVTIMKVLDFVDVTRKVPYLDAKKNQLIKEVKVKAPRFIVLNRFMLNGMLYQDQWEAMDSFLERYRIYRLDIDSTGVGDATGDYYLKKYNKWSWDVLKKYESLKIRGVAKPVKFTAKSKHDMYLNWDIALKEGRYLIPCVDGMTEDELSCHKRFKVECLNALREWKGSLLSVRHPDPSKGEHGDVYTDDSLDSAALPFHDIEQVPHRHTVARHKKVI